MISFYPPHQQADVRFTLSSALQAVISLRLVPRADRPGRIAGVRGAHQHGRRARQHPRPRQGSSHIPDLIRDGTVQYGMQIFDQSLMNWYSKGVISYESALFYATNPSEFALKVQGVAGSSDTSWDELQAGPGEVTRP